MKKRHAVHKYDSYNMEIEVLVPSGAKVLDIGCNTGRLAKALKKRGCVVTGVDVSKNLLNLAKKHCHKTVCADAENLAALNKGLGGQHFDVIILGDVVEHLRSPKIFLINIKRFLKPTGKIIASIPNSAFIWIRFKFLVGNFHYSPAGGLMDEDHLRFFSFGSVKDLFREAGYQISSIKPSNHGIVKRKYFLIKFLGRIIPTMFAIHILVIAQK